MLVIDIIEKISNYCNVDDILNLLLTNISNSKLINKNLCYRLSRSYHYPISKSFKQLVRYSTYNNSMFCELAAMTDNVNLFKEYFSFICGNNNDEAKITDIVFKYKSIEIINYLFSINYKYKFEKYLNDAVTNNDHVITKKLLDYGIMDNYELFLKTDNINMIKLLSKYKFNHLIYINEKVTDFIYKHKYHILYILLKKNIISICNEINVTLFIKECSSSYNLYDKIIDKMIDSIKTSFLTNHKIYDGINNNFRF
jgi:hypothetical protein